MSNDSDLSTIYQRPVELLQSLIRFDSSNPPGNESECVAYIDRLLTAAGFETAILANDPKRDFCARCNAQSGEEAGG